jgi:hypothetical protein
VAAGLVVRAALPHLVLQRTRAALRAHLNEEAELEDVDLSLIGTDITFERLAVPAPEGQAEPTLFSFESLRIDLGSLRHLGKGEVQLDEIRLRGPRLALVTREDGHLNLSGILAHENRGPGRSGQMPAIELSQGRLEDGVISWHDRRFTPPLVTVLEGIEMEIADLRSPVPRGTLNTVVSLAAELDGAPLRVSSRGDYFALPETDFDLDLTLTDLDVTHFEPHFGRRSPIEIVRGEADLRFVGACRGGELDMTLEISFHDFETRRRRGQGVRERVLGVAPRAAISFFHSEKAREPIVVAVRGDLSDPEYDFGEAIQEAVRRSLRARIRGLIDSGELVVRSAAGLGSEVGEVTGAAAGRVLDAGEAVPIAGRVVEGSRDLAERAIGTVGDRAGGQVENLGSRVRDLGTRAVERVESLSPRRESSGEQETEAEPRRN